MRPPMERAPQTEQGALDSHKPNRNVWVSPDGKQETAVVFMGFWIHWPSRPHGWQLMVWKRKETVSDRP